MSNPSPDPKEIERQLRNLTQRQCQILYWVGRGLVYKEIATLMHCGQDLIQKEMSLMYRGLGLTRLRTSEKRRLLNTLICPIHQRMLSDPEKDCAAGVIDATPPVIDQQTLKEVLEDEQRGLVPLDTALIRVSQSGSGGLPEGIGRQTTMAPVPPSYSHQSPLPWILVGVLGTLLVVAAIAIVALLPQQPSTIAQKLPPLVTPSNQLPQAVPSTPLPTTPLPTHTLQPTDTPLPPPSNTPTIEPAFSRGQVMFTDDFEQGIGPTWKFPSGNWITANGRLTAQNNDNYVWLWAVIDQPAWTNYLVSVDINVPYFSSMAQQPIAVAVRVTNAQKKYLSFYCDRYCGWSYIGAPDPEYISGRNYDGVEKGIYEIEAIGNQFVARINGRESQRISLSGYDRGGIVLGMRCNYSLGCPSFDNLKVTAQ